ncbi:MAG: VirE protein, partial [candidate division Zixibacteria bacterium]|nr:VirE protein [candidate division Zixibacteria bacterium]
LRNTEDAKEARKYKAYNFDYVTFSGIFSKRNEKALTNHSGLLTIDFDHISNISALKKQLLKDQYFETELMFISPSGDGLKWIIPIDVTKAKHQDFFKAVSNYIRQFYQLEVDQSGKDISRACFIPHDAAAYINPKYL